MVTVVTMKQRAGGGVKIIVTIVTTVTGERGRKSRGHTCGWRLPQGNTTRTP